MSKKLAIEKMSHEDRVKEILHTNKGIADDCKDLFLALGMLSESDISQLLSIIRAKQETARKHGYQQGIHTRKY